MTNSKKILITSATSEIFVLRRGRQKAICARCEICKTEMIDLNSAVAVFGWGTRELVGQIGTGAVHCAETASGHLLVCKKSIEALIRETK